MTDLSPEAQKAVEQVVKLLALAEKNPNPEEAASAAAKANEILLRFNLDMALVDKSKGKDQGRQDAAFKGGLYKWQRMLWRYVAELNFCLYFTHYKCLNYEERQRAYKQRHLDMGSDKPYAEWTKVPKERWQFQHQVVGRKHNVVATRVMAEYLEQTIERLTRERVGDGSQYFTRWAISYREGMADTITDKIIERRNRIVSEERKKEREAFKRAQEAGISTATTLTLSHYIDAETDANNDFLYGEGWSAKRKAEAEEAREKRRRQAEWDKAHPEEAKEREEKRRKERRSWGRSPRERDKDWGAYAAGQEKGKSVSIDPQVDGDRKRIGR